MQDESVVELFGFDSQGILCGRAAVIWATGSWTVWAGGALTCNIWGRAEVERILRQYGAVEIQEGDGGKGID